MGTLRRSRIGGGHNGGRSQVNFNFLQVGYDFPFLNCMKTAQQWGFANDTDAPVTPDLLDDDGYPTSIVNGGVKTVFFVPTQIQRPGNYVITWTGNGTVRTGMNATTVSGSKTGSGGSGRYVFSTTDSRFDIGISATPVSNLKVFHADDEAAIDRGEIFGAKFKARLAEAKFGVLRFLNWGGYSGGFNASNVTTWATRKPISHVFYGGYQLKNSLYGGTTSLTAQAYSVSGPSGFVLDDKATVHVKFDQSYAAVQVSFSNGSANIGWTAHGLSVNSRIIFSLDTVVVSGTVPTNFSRGVIYYVVSVPDADTITVSATQGGSAIVAGSAATGVTMGNAVLTMNVNGTGAKDIRGEGSQLLVDFFNSRPVSGNSKALATLIYDAALDVWIKYGGDNAINSMGIDNCVPPEVMVQLAYETRCHPWFTLPYFALDPATDYIPELMNYTKTYPGASWMIPRWEPCNEVWNSSGGFYQTPYANNKATANWGSGDYQDEYGKWLSTVGQIAADIYGSANLGITYQVMCGVQTAGSTVSSVVRLSASKYVAQAAAAQSLVWSGGTINLTKAAAAASPGTVYVSHVSPANYITPSDKDDGTEATRVTAFAPVRFTASISAGVMTVTGSPSLAAGKTVFGRGIASGNLQSGVTIVSGSNPTWTLSDTSITLASDTFYAASDMTQPALYVDSLNSGAGGFNLTNLNAKYVAWKSFGAARGVNGMAGYEGGYSPDYNPNTPTTNLLRFAGKLVASSPGSANGLQGYLTQTYNNFIDAGGEFPSCFQFSGIYPSGSAWAVLEDIYQSPDPPQWLAIKAFNA